MINEQEQIKQYIEDKRPTSTMMWVFYGVVAIGIVGVSAWVNWQFGAARAGVLGGLIALSLDAILFITCLRHARKHNGVNAGMDGFLICLLMLVGVICAAGFFTVKGGEKQYNQTVETGTKLTGAITNVNQEMTKDERLDSNYANVKVAAALASYKTPPPPEQKLYTSISHVTESNPAVVELIFNMMIGSLLVIGSVLATSRVNSYYCPMTLNSFKRGVEKNNEVINGQTRAAPECRELARLDNTGIDGNQENGELPADMDEAKYKDVELWVLGLDSGKQVTIANIKNHGNTTSKKRVDFIKNKLLKNSLIVKEKNGSGCYYHTPVEDSERVGQA